MIRYRHRGCHSEVIRYIGDAAPTAGMAMRSVQWELPGGVRPLPGSSMPVACPDCGMQIRITGTQLVAITSDADELRAVLRAAA